MKNKLKTMALAFVIGTERSDEALVEKTLRAYCAGIDVERLQDAYALNRDVPGTKLPIVKAYRKLRRAVLK